MFIAKESLRSYEKFLKICGPLAKIMVVIFKNVNKNKNFFASPWKKIRRQEKIVAIEFFHRQSKISSPALFCVAFLLTCRRRQRCTPLDFRVINLIWCHNNVCWNFFENETRLRHYGNIKTIENNLIPWLI